MKIVKPAHGQGFNSDAQVEFSGLIDPPLPLELENVDLYYRWYSSLFKSTKNRFSMNDPARQDPSIPFWTKLGMGTQVITLAASDVPGESKDDQKNITHFGVTGGNGETSPCVIHVFKAVIIGSIESIDPTETTGQKIKIRVAGPIAWNIWNPKRELFEHNQDYHSINRLKYEFILEPVGSPAGRPTVPLNPEPGDLVVDTEVDDPNDIDPGRLLYSSVLGDPLPQGRKLTGLYKLRLFVKDKNGDLEGDETSASVAF